MPLAKKIVSSSGYSTPAMTTVTRNPNPPPPTNKRLKPPVAPASGDPSIPLRLGTHRESEVASRQGARPPSGLGAVCRVGQLWPPPLPRLPHPQRGHPSFRPPARPLPTLARYRLPAPPSPRVSQAASKRGERSGMGLAGGGSGHGVGAGFFVASRERCSRSAAVVSGARRRTTETDPLRFPGAGGGGCR